MNPDPILFWNQVALDANQRDHTFTDRRAASSPQRGPTLSSRAAALVHLAMHDAYFGIVGAGAIPGPGPAAKHLWLLTPPAWGGATGPVQAAAAVTGAAAWMLARLYADQRTEIEASAAEAARVFGHDAAAHAFGVRIAELVMASRAGEVTSIDDRHAANPNAPHHRPDPYDGGQGYLGVAYGKNHTFAVTTFATLAAPPTPTNNPALYNQHVAEVATNGSLSGPGRTPEELTIGLVWAYDGPQRIGTPPRLYNQVLRLIAASRSNTPAQNARMLALANVAMGDAGIHAWHYKYQFDLWRPAIGVREHAGASGPAASPIAAVPPVANPYWQAFGAPRTNSREQSATPPFPAYPSGHATFGAAAFEACRAFYGFAANQVDTLAFDLVSDEVNGVAMHTDGSTRPRINRSYPSLVKAIYDNSISRIYLGVHWRFDGTTGQNQTQMLSATDNIGGVPLGRAIALDIVNSGMRQQASPPKAS